MTWKDPARVEMLKALWADGLSGSQIGDRLGGLTRAQVIGKAHRLGVASRATAARTAVRQSRPRPATLRPAKQRPRMGPRDDLGSLPPLPLPEAQAEDVARVSTLDLEPWHCRWAVGDPIEVGPHAPLFCGERKLPGLPYCEAHARRAFQPPEAGRRARPEAEPTPVREMETVA